MKEPFIGQLEEALGIVVEPANDNGPGSGPTVVDEWNWCKACCMGHAPGEHTAKREEEAVMEDTEIVGIKSVDTLVLAAQKAGMDVPPDTSNYRKEDYPHFAVFEVLQLGRPMPTEWSHYTNAKIIAKIPKDKVRNMPAREILLLGYR